MTFEARNNGTQNQPERILARPPGFAQTVESTQSALPEILQLPRKRRAREAYHWYMLMAGETERFLEGLLKKE